MYSWIKGFLTERSIRVKVGSALSEKFLLENGTPQGSVISPILFLMMINDIPTANDNETQMSLYADDSAVWRSGRNIQFIIKELQQQMDAISKWCRKWGFKINEDKTVYMVFTRKSSRMTWGGHIDYIVEKSKRKINLLRSLTGQSWGASKTSLLKIYRSLIRSRLDYGCSVIYTASENQLKKLDVIQSTCLRICCGAMRTTPIHALQQECG